MTPGITNSRNEGISQKSIDMCIEEWVEEF